MEMVRSLKQNKICWLILVLTNENGWFILVLTNNNCWLILLPTNENGWLDPLDCLHEVHPLHGDVILGKAGQVVEELLHLQQVGPIGEDDSDILIIDECLT